MNATAHANRCARNSRQFHRDVELLQRGGRVTLDLGANGPVHEALQCRVALEEVDAASSRCLVVDKPNLPSKAWSLRDWLGIWIILFQVLGDRALQFVIDLKNPGAQ